MCKYRINSTSVAYDTGEPVIVVAPAQQQRIAHVAEIHLCLPLTEGQQIFGSAPQLLRCAGREHTEIPRHRRVVAFDPRGLFDDEMGVGAAETEGAGHGAPSAMVASGSMGAAEY